MRVEWVAWEAMDPEHSAQDVVRCDICDSPGPHYTVAVKSVLETTCCSYPKASSY